MYFNDTYTVCDTHKRKAFKKRYKDTYHNQDQYTLTGLYKALSTWNKESVKNMDNRFK